MKIILLGPSGSGKGTLADFIRKDFGVPHVSTGDLFRDNVARKTPLGILVKEQIAAGLWVSDDITMRMLMDRLGEEDAQCGCIIDGVPRTMTQVWMLDANVNVDLVIELDVSDEIVIDRLTSRYVCKDCKTNHNIKLGPVDACRKCSGELYQREDDCAEAIAFRLKQFRSSLGDIKKHYDEKGLLLSIPVTDDMLPHEIYRRVEASLRDKGIFPTC